MTTQTILITTAKTSKPTVIRYKPYWHNGKKIWLTQERYLKDFVCNGVELERA